MNPRTFIIIVFATLFFSASIAVARAEPATKKPVPAAKANKYSTAAARDFRVKWTPKAEVEIPTVAENK